MIREFLDRIEDFKEEHPITFAVGKTALTLGIFGVGCYAITKKACYVIGEEKRAMDMAAIACEVDNRMRDRGIEMVQIYSGDKVIGAGIYQTEEMGASEIKIKTDSGKFTNFKAINGNYGWN